MCGRASLLPPRGLVQRHYVGTCRRAAEHDEPVEDYLNGVPEPDLSRNLLQSVDGEFNRVRFADGEVDAGVKINDAHGSSNFEGRSGRGSYDGC
jgi:hypothetical protein